MVARATAAHESTEGNFQTAYGYDPLGDLLTVNQGGRPRTFGYDSLSRLTSATNPESGTVGYSYNDTGTLHQRSDALNVVTTDTYDALNRLKGTSYSDNTSSVAYTYGTFQCGFHNKLRQL